MQCAQCGFMLSPFDKFCPRCQHVPGTPVPPFIPLQAPVAPAQAPPPVQVGTSAGTAAKAGFFGFLGVGTAACLLPVGCALLVLLGLVMAMTGAMSFAPPESTPTHTTR